MKINKEESLRNFEFWSGAADTVKELTPNQMDEIEIILAEQYPEGMDETELNDFFWFDRDTIADWLGYDDFDKLMRDEFRED